MGAKGSKQKKKKKQTEEVEPQIKVPQIKVIMLGMSGGGQTTLMDVVCGVQRPDWYRAKKSISGEGTELGGDSWVFHDIHGGDPFTLKDKKEWDILLFFPAELNILFTVDTIASEEQLAAGKELLYKILACPDFEGCPLLVIANEQDLPPAIGATDVVNKFELNSITNRPWRCQAACGTTGDGMEEGLLWLAKAYKQRYQAERKKKEMERNQV